MILIHFQIHRGFERSRNGLALPIKAFWPSLVVLLFCSANLSAQGTASTPTFEQSKEKRAGITDPVRFDQSISVAVSNPIYVVDNIYDHTYMYMQ